MSAAEPFLAARKTGSIRTVVKTEPRCIAWSARWPDWQLTQLVAAKNVQLCVLVEGQIRESFFQSACIHPLAIQCDELVTCRHAGSMPRTAG